MYRLLLVVCLVLAGCASTNTIQQNGYIRTTGVGKTFDEAKQDAFTKAIEIVVGSVIVADSRALDNKIIKDDIIKYSAGYVDNFNVISKTLEPNKVTVVVDVSVKSSRIAERILGKTETIGNVEGTRMTAQYQTYLQDRNSGDKLLQEVLQDFEKHGYQLTQGKTEFKLDRWRNAIIIIPFEIRWNQHYLVGLNEALKVTQDSKEYAKQERVIVKSKNPKAWLIGESNTYYFNDSRRAQSVKYKFLGQVNVFADVLDAKGEVVFQGCAQGIHNGLYATEPFVIEGNTAKYNEVHIVVKNGDPNFYRLDSANIVQLSYSFDPCD